MTPRRTHLRLLFGALALAAGLVGVACSLSPQPLPPSAGAPAGGFDDGTKGAGQPDGATFPPPPENKADGGMATPADASFGQDAGPRDGFDAGDGETGSPGDATT